MHNIYCGKFGLIASFEEFKRKAQSVIITNEGRRCSTREFKSEATNRVKTLDSLIKENTLYEVKVNSEAFKAYATNFAKLEKEGIEKVEWTRKVSSEKVDQLLLNAICKAAGDYSSTHQPKNLTDIASIIQTAQIIYQQLSSKPAKLTQWRVNIETKIDIWKNQIKNLEKVLNIKKLSKKLKSKHSSL